MKLFSFKEIFYQLDHKEKKTFFLILFLSPLVFIFEFFNISLLIPIISQVFSFEINFVNFTFLNNIIYSDFNLTFYLLVFLFVFFIKNFFLFLYLKKTYNFTYQLKKSLTKKILNQIINLKFKEFMLLPKSKMLRNISTEIGFFCGLINSLINFLAEFFIIFSLLIFILILNFKLSLIIFCIAGLISFLIFISIKNKIKIISNERKFFSEKFIHIFNLIIDSYTELKFYDKFKSYKDYFNKNSSSLYKNEYKISVLNLIPKYLIELILLSLVIGYLLFLKENINSTLPFLTIFVFILVRVLPSLNKIIFHAQNIIYSAPSVKTINEININYQHNQQQIIKDKKKITDFNLLEIKDLSFSYDNKNKILNKICLKINKNRFIGFIGNSGSGKTTLVRILMGLLENYQGSMFFDEVEITDFNNQISRSSMAYLPQKVNLLPTTIFENITFSQNFQDKQIHEVLNLLKDCKLDHIFKEKKDLIKEIDDKNSNFSVGELQRIGLARCLYLKPKVIFLDEPTSALDGKNEKQLMEMILGLENVTKIMITHNHNLIKNCDDVFKISNGEVIKIK